MAAYDIAVVIVNYNVKAFLHFCLRSVQNAAKNINVEIIVVDNASTDDSTQHLKQAFPEIKIIQNEKNLGFGKASNIGWRASSSQFVLFLNPDTVVSENALKVCLHTIRSDKRIGAIGARMYDGSGNYLPESKRGTLTPQSAFYKLTRLNKLFSSSAHFNQYYLGHLDQNNPQKVECLTGAFFFTRRSILEETGGFDERFFMYGEDIDLSHRIRELDKDILYLPQAEILHFKGESTQKSSYRYFRDFYGAMIKFVSKNYAVSKSWYFLLLLRIGIVASTVLGFLRRLLSWMLPMVFDGSVIILCVYGVSTFWANYYHQDPHYFELTPLAINIGMYTLIWLSMMKINGVYDRPNKVQLTVQSLFQGIVIILAIYALLGSSLQSSRAIILLGFAVVLIFLGLLKLCNELLFHRSSKTVYFKEAPGNDFQNVLRPLGYSQFEQLSVEDEKHHRIKGDVLMDVTISSAQRIIDIIKNPTLRSLILWDPEYELLISSSDKNEKGKVIEEANLYQITHPAKRIYKRIFDIVAVFILFISVPIGYFFIDKSFVFFSSLFQIIRGQKTVISYNGALTDHNLPSTRPGFFFPNANTSKNELFLRAKDYALHYSFLKDLSIFISHYADIVRKLSEEK